MKPTIIAIVGASGSGKTYLSKLLQNELNVSGGRSAAVFLR